MARTIPFSLVDVFAERALSGNPLAVVREAESLDEPTLKGIAREFNQSETTFLLPPTLPGATWRLRSFTPAGAEVVGVGHNALGAWWWLATQGVLALSSATSYFAQQLGDRVLPVEILSGHNGRAQAVVMEQARPMFGAILSQLAPASAALGLSPDVLRTDVPAQVVDTGAAHLLIAAIDREIVDSARPDASSLRSLLAAVGGQGCYLYALDPLNPKATAYARFFNPTVGIWEDPATGSAAGPLACLLVAQKIVPDDSVVLVEQGHALGRPSVLRVDVSHHRVRLSGAGVVVAEGNLRLDP